MALTIGFPSWGNTRANIGIRRYFPQYEGTLLGPWRNFEPCGPAMVVTTENGYQYLDVTFQQGQQIPHDQFPGPPDGSYAVPTYSGWEVLERDWNAQLLGYGY
jgi:hypothetical protein